MILYKKSTSCAHRRRVWRNGQYVCADCGVILDERVEEAPWRDMYVSRDGKSMPRVGPPMMPGIGPIYSQIETSGRDHSGKWLSAGKRMEMLRLKDLQRRVVDTPYNRTLTRAKDLIEWLRSEFESPKHVSETALLFFVQYKKKSGKKRIKSIKYVAMAAFYAACKVANLPITSREISARTGVRETIIEKYYNELKRVLKISNEKLSVPPEAFVDKIVGQLRLPTKVDVLAKYLIKKAKELGLTSGRSKSGIAGAATYIAARVYDVGVTQEDIARVVNVTPVTIRQRSRDFMERINIIIKF